jgi:hypothetical protein
MGTGWEKAKVRIPGPAGVGVGAAEGDAVPSAPTERADMTAVRASGTVTRAE